jgi:hypothetical protein
MVINNIGNRSDMPWCPVKYLVPIPYPCILKDGHGIVINKLTPEGIKGCNNGYSNNEYERYGLMVGVGGI